MHCWRGHGQGFSFFFVDTDGKGILVRTFLLIFFLIDIFGGEGILLFTNTQIFLALTQ